MKTGIVVFSGLIALLGLGLQTNKEAEIKSFSLKGCVQCQVNDIVIDCDSSLLSWKKSCPHLENCLPNPLNLKQNTLVGASFYADCMATHDFKGHTSPDSKTYIIDVKEHNGHCANSNMHDYWLLIPKLPKGYTAELGMPEQAD